MNRCQIESLELRTLLNSSLVADYNGVFPADAVTIGGISYFTADEGLHGYELWRSDGTIAGTTLVKDLIAGKADSQITLAGELDGALLFFGRLDDGMISLWRSDGTTAGTSKLADMGNQDSRAKLLSGIVNDRLLFVIHGGDADPHVTLWASGGTNASTSLVKVLYDGADYNYIDRWIVAGDRIVIATAGDDFWGTDGTNPGTVNIGASIAPAGGRIRMTPRSEVLSRGAVYFATETQPNTILWKTDGTLAGTVQVKTFDGATNLANVVTANDNVIFQVVDQDFTTSQLWRTDGTESGTEWFATIEGRIGNVYPQAVELGGAGLFMTTKDLDPVHHRVYEVSLWRSDATANGTYLLKTFRTGRWEMYSSTMIDGSVYFVLQGRFDQPFVFDHRELWRTDGTAAGTALVQDLSQYRRTDLETQMRYLNDHGGIPTVMMEEDRDCVAVSNSDGRIAVKTPGDTLVFDPTTMTAPIGPAHGYARLENDGTLRVFGTLNADNIRVYRAPSDPTKLVVKLNGINQTFPIDSVARVRIYGYGGDDQICVLEKYGTINKRLAVWGGDGNDLVYGGVGRDSIWGENGNDTINSGKGDDTLAGGSGDDTVIGSHGTDVVSGGGGDDCIDGGFGTDVIFGEQVFEIFYNGKQGQDRNDIVELVLN